MAASSRRGKPDNDSNLSKGVSKATVEDTASQTGLPRFTDIAKAKITQLPAPIEVTPRRKQRLVDIAWDAFEDSSNLLIEPNLWYLKEKDKEENKPEPPIDFLLKERTLSELFEFLSDAPAEVLHAQVALARRQGATFSSPESRASPRLADAPPLWAERKRGWNEGTGEKAGPALWIKMHYGNKNPKEWDPMGLTRAHLRHDRPLYDAYAKWVQAPDREDLGLPSEPRRKVADPVSSLDRHREASLRSYHNRR